MLDDVFQEGQDTYPAHLPWIFNREPCGECAESKKGLCRRHWAIHPREVIPFPLDSDVNLPCTGRWELFDTEEPTQEALSLCASCPIRRWCIDTATANREWGIWGGTTSQERAERRKDAA